MFLIQGGDDRIVRAELTDDFVETMKAEGPASRTSKIDGDGYGVACDESVETTGPMIEEFLARHLKPDRTR